MTFIKEHNFSNKYFVILSIVTLFLLPFCSVKLIADYDEIIERSATDLQKNINFILFRLERIAETKEGNYDNYHDFYDNTKVELYSLLIRAEAIPNNEITAKQINNLIENFLILENMHKKGIKQFEIKPIRDAINIQFASIIKLELAKKRENKINSN